MNDDAYQADRDQQLEAMLADGRFDQAMEMLETWYRDEPWNSGILMRMAVVHWMAGQPAHTLRDLDALLQLEPGNAEALSRRAQALLMLGKHEDAEAALAKAEALDPNTPGVVLNRALIFESHNEYEQAIAALGQYLAMAPQDYLALARRSHLYRQLGNYPQALEDALASVQINEKDAETHFAEALARITLEQGAEALRAVENSLRANPAFLPALRLKIDLLADLGQVAIADGVLQQLVTLEPDSSYTALLQARMATEHGDFTRAITWANRYLDDCPDDPYGYYRRGMISFRMEDYARALEDFREYGRLSPKALEAHEQQFLCLLELKRYDEAMQAGITALALQPQNYRLHYNLAFVQLLSGMAEDAFAGFYQATALAPGNDELLIRIHLALAEHTGPPQVLHWFQEAVRRHGAQSPMMKGLLAEAYLELGQADAALALTEEVLQLDPRRPFGYLLGIKALCLLNRYDQALMYADLGIAALPDDSRIRLARAALLRDLNRQEEALQELDLAGMLLPGDPEIVRQQALIFGSLGQVDKAVELLEAVTAQGGEPPETHFWLGYFLIHCRRYRQALASGDQLITLVPQAAEGHFIRGIALQGLKRRQEAEAELTRVQVMDPALVARLEKDPVIAALLQGGGERLQSNKARRAISRGWKKLARLFETGAGGVEGRESFEQGM